MAVVFKTLTRGLWKNRATPEVSKTYQYRITVDPEGSHKIFQPKVRSNSTLVGRKYNYDPALEVPGKILFGTSPSQTQYDFSDFAWMPFKQPENVIYKAHSKEMNIPLTIHRDNQIKPYSSYSSRFSSRSGIYYGKLKAQVTEITMSSFDWSGVSVADKYSIPTLMQISTYPRQYAAGMIMTRSIERLGSTVDRDIYIYQNRIVDGDTTLWMDDDDHNAKVRFIYMVLQSPGGSGGNSRNTFFAWVSGSGGGAGGWSLDLVEIPENGYLKVHIPAVPTNTKNDDHYSHGSRVGSIIVTDHMGNTLRTVLGGENGLTWDANNDRRVDGGYGGYVKESKEFLNQHFANSGSTIKNIKSCRGGEGARVSGDSPNLYSGSSPKIMINETENTPDTIITDGQVVISTIEGIRFHWPNEIDALDVPGGGGSSPLGKGGNFDRQSDGYSGNGPGAGGGGGSKTVFGKFIGGSGCTAAVYIGY